MELYNLHTVHFREGVFSIGCYAKVHGVAHVDGERQVLLALSQTAYMSKSPKRGKLTREHGCLKGQSGATEQKRGVALHR